MRRLLIVAAIAVGLVGCKSPVQRALERIAVEMNAACPLEMTEFLRIEGVSVEPNLTLRLDYTTLTDYFDTEHAKSEETKRSVAGPLMMLIERNPILNRITFHAVYKDLEGTLLGEIVITPEDLARYASEQSVGYEAYVAGLREEIENMELPLDMGDGFTLTEFKIDEPSRTVTYQYTVIDKIRSGVENSSSEELKESTIEDIRSDAASWALMAEMVSYFDVKYDYIDSKGKVLNSFTLTIKDLRPEM